MAACAGTNRGRLKELEKQNARLKKLVAELSLDKDILQVALQGKY